MEDVAYLFRELNQISSKQSGYYMNYFLATNINP